MTVTDTPLDTEEQQVSNLVDALLAEFPPKSTDVIGMFFDNVGGDQLEVAIDAMRTKGRIALCGAIALYDGDNYRAGPRNLFGVIEKHVSLTGFNAGFYFDQAPQIIAEFVQLEAQGVLICEETVIDGLDAMPQGFVDMLAGANKGKMLVRL